MIAPERAKVLWNTDDDTMRISGLRIVDRDHVDTTFAYSGGACCSDWMKPGRHEMTPLGLFLRLVTTYGFANEWIAQNALHEFMHVRGQTWALAAWVDNGGPPAVRMMQRQAGDAA